jgi:predicted acetyltransferase
VSQLEIRTATADDFVAVCDLLSAAFADEFPEDEREHDRFVFEPERDLLMVDGDTPVGNAGVYTRNLTLPGGVSVPAAHVTMVGVSPTYRRQGVLTRLMAQQLRDVRAAGEPVAVLWASEGRIYQRFGYGLACLKLSFEIDLREVRMSPRAAAAGGRLRDAAPRDARKDLQQVYERVRLQRPGWSTRDERWWDRAVNDPASRRRGATAHRAVLYETGDGIDGYALWRTKASWSPAGPDGEARVGEFVAATPEAYSALWRFLLTMDLMRTLRFSYAAVDEPLLYLVNEPRRLNANATDALWARLVDVPAALEARRYAAPLDVVIEVDDAMLPENAGRWRLRAIGDTAQREDRSLRGPQSQASSTAQREDRSLRGPQSQASYTVSCTPSADPAELACDVSDLGAAYLGEASLAALGAAGRVVERRPGALAAASAAFGWYRAPSAIEVF